MEAAIFIAIIVLASLMIWFAIELCRRSYKASNEEVPDSYHHFIQHGVELSEAILASRTISIDEGLELNRTVNAWEQRVHEFVQREFPQTEQVGSHHSNQGNGNIC